MRGFTLVEVLIVTFIVGVLATISFSSYKNFQQNSDINSAQKIVVNSLRRAKDLAYFAKNDDNWGVKIENNNVTIFRGDDFTTRDDAYDKYFFISQNINIDDALTEVVFNKFTGIPQSTGDIEIFNNKKSKIITINDKGIIF